MTDDRTEAFLEGAAAAIANHGAGQWNNPYMQPLADAKKRGEPTDDLLRKFEEWDQGWEWRAANIGRY